MPLSNGTRESDIEQPKNLSSENKKGLSVNLSNRNNLRNDHLLVHCYKLEINVKEEKYLEKGDQAALQPDCPVQSTWNRMKRSFFDIRQKVLLGLIYHSRVKLLSKPFKNNELNLEKYSILSLENVISRP